MNRLFLAIPMLLLTPWLVSSVTKVSRFVPWSVSCMFLNFCCCKRRLEKLFVYVLESYSGCLANSLFRLSFRDFKALFFDLSVFFWNPNGTY